MRASSTEHWHSCRIRDASFAKRILHRSGSRLWMAQLADGEQQRLRGRIELFERLLLGIEYHLVQSWLVQHAD